MRYSAFRPKVTANMTNGSTVSVVSGTGVVIWTGPQRDLYRKYGWPAKKPLQAHLQMYKEEVLGLD